MCRILCIVGWWAARWGMRGVVDGGSGRVWSSVAAAVGASAVVGAAEGGGGGPRRAHLTRRYMSVT